MQNVFIVIVFLGGLLGVVLFTITYLGLKKMLKEHDMLNKGKSLSDRENKIFKRHLFYMLLGFTVSVITSLTNLILLFRSRSF